MGLPNQLSILRIILTPIFVILLLSDNLIAWYFSLGVFTIAVLTDWYDGYIARKYDNISKLGKFLDPLADKVLIITSLIMFNRLGYIPNWIILVIILRDLVITSLRIYVINSNNPVRTNFFGKIKTFGQLIVLFYIFLYHIFIHSREVNVDDNILSILLTNKVIIVLLYGITIITVISGVVYLVNNRYHLKKLAVDIYRIFLPSEF